MPILHNDKATPEAERALRSPCALIWFTGIGGVSVSALACLCRELGYRVAGSDREEGARLSALRLRGIDARAGHFPRSAMASDLLVYTSAVTPDDPEVVAARTAGIPTVSRAQLIGLLSPRYRRSVGISGTHGKSTVTAMTAAALAAAGEQPTVLCGAELAGGLGYSPGGSDTLIFEACEYLDSFLRMSPTVAAVTNVSYDHPDWFADISAVRRSFSGYVAAAPCAAVIPEWDGWLADFIKPGTRRITYGFGVRCDCRITDAEECGGYYSFTLSYMANRVGRVSLSVPGEHNMRDAAAAFSTACAICEPTEGMCAALSSFRALPRRLSRICRVGARDVYYDYAHHPEEMKCTLETLRKMYGTPPVAVFAPHTYSRTAALMEDFAAVLSAVPALITPIYPAREKPIEGVSGRVLADKCHGVYENDPYRAVDYILGETSGTIVLMGAGELDGIRSLLLARSRYTPPSEN